MNRKPNKKCIKAKTKQKGGKKKKKEQKLFFYEQITHLNCPAA